MAAELKATLEKQSGKAQLGQKDQKVQNEDLRLGNQVKKASFFGWTNHKEHRLQCGNYNAFLQQYVIKCMNRIFYITKANTIVEKRRAYVAALLETGIANCDQQAAYYEFLKIRECNQKKDWSTLPLMCEYRGVFNTPLGIRERLAHAHLLNGVKRDIQGRRLDNSNESILSTTGFDTFLSEINSETDQLLPFEVLYNHVMDYCEQEGAMFENGAQFQHNLYDPYDARAFFPTIEEDLKKTREGFSKLFDEELARGECLFWEAGISVDLYRARKFLNENLAVAKSENNVEQLRIIERMLKFVHRDTPEEMQRLAKIAAHAREIKKHLESIKNVSPENVTAIVNKFLETLPSVPFDQPLNAEVVDQFETLQFKAVQPNFSSSLSPIHSSSHSDKTVGDTGGSAVGNESHLSPEDYKKYREFLIRYKSLKKKYLNAHSAEHRAQRQRP